MKKNITIILFVVCLQTIFAQTTDYRTSEDGINRLLENPQFVEDVINMGTGELSSDKLNDYFAKYVPEYSNFKIGKSTIDFNKIYYANAEGASTSNLANLLGAALKLNPAQTQSLLNTFSGNLVYSPTSNLSSGLAGKLYERGKDAKVDYGVDSAVDFFQSKLGDGGLNSSLIDLGGGLLGGFANMMNAREQKRIEDAAKEKIIMEDLRVYTSGINAKPEQEDLVLNFKAIMAVAEDTDYNKAINLLDQAISNYKKNPNRAYYLYNAYNFRAYCKMQLAAYRAAIIDYYFGNKILESILKGNLPDNSILYSYTSEKKPKLIKKTGTLNNKNLVNIILNRAFAKYRAKDYNGSISDAKLALQTLADKNIPSLGVPNDYKDISLSIMAMDQFGLEQYKESYSNFYNANLSDVILDYPNTNIEMSNLNGFPNYFPFDIYQIKGLSYYKNGRFDEAISIYEKILSSENDRMENGKGLKKAFTKADGDISSVYASLASFYYEKGGNYQKAISFLDNAISINPTQIEYYFKRGNYKKANNQIKEAEADFKIVKNPKLLTENLSKTQSFEFYNTKYEKALITKNDDEIYKIIKEAIKSYPNETPNFNWALKYLNNSKSSEKASELAQLYQLYSPMKYHVLKALQYSFSSEIQKEKEEMFQAFENGANFYSLTNYEINEYSYYSYMAIVNNLNDYIHIQSKPYYCELLLKYMSRTNNNFIPIDFNKEEKQRKLIAKYESDKLKFNLDKKSIKATDDREELRLAKSLGNYEEYLKILNAHILKDDPSFILDKIELLIILDRKKEAIAFAKKNYKKLANNVSLSGINEVDKMLLSNIHTKAIENIANGGCE